MTTKTARTYKPMSAREIEARGRARDLGVRVRVVEPAREYTTVSQSGEGTYHLHRTANGWTCGCKGFEFTGSCKHLGALQRRADREGWSFGRIASPASTRVEQGWSEWSVRSEI